MNTAFVHEFFALADTGVQTGAADLTGEGSLAATGTRTVFGTAVLSGTGTLTATAAVPAVVVPRVGRPVFRFEPRVVYAEAHLHGHGWLSATGERRLSDRQEEEELVVLLMV